MEADQEDKAYRWEGDYEKTWEAIREDETGSLQGSIQKEIIKAKRRRLETKKKSVRLGMMRHLYIVLDMSAAMREKDLKPNRFILTLKLVKKFCENFFDQNPIGQVGFITTSNKRASILSSMSGTLHRHMAALNNIEGETIENNGKYCEGEPSLQNSIELAAQNLKHLPGHTSREILIIMGSLTSCDPKPIIETINNMKNNNICCSVIGLSAELFICKKLTNITGGSYGVILDENHFADILNDHIIPPSSGLVTESSLLKMGFPHLISPDDSNKPSMCMTTKKISIGGYYCPQCQAKYYNLPVQCIICGLTLVSAPHLARSYHHLFPLPDFAECNINQLDSKLLHECNTCKINLVSNCYECSRCKVLLCIDCHLLIRENLHSCPGCMSNRCEMEIISGGI